MIPTRSGNGPSSAAGGRPLIFIHGWAMDSSVWERQADYFRSKGFHVFTLDLPGHGDAHSGESFTLSHAASSIESLITEGRLERPLLVGWSMGAQVIFELITRFVIEISAACFVGGTPRFTATDGYPHGLPLKDLRGMKAKLKRDFRRTVSEFREAISAGLGGDEKRLVTEATLPSYDAALGGLGELERADYRGTLSKIEIPLLLIHGDNDRVCPFGAAEYMAERVQRAELLAIEGEGHLPFLSKATLFNKKLEEFIRRN